MGKRKERFCTVIVFFGCLILSACIIYGIEMKKLSDLREKTGYVTASQVTQLQYVMNTLFLKTQTLEMLIMEGGGNISRFEDIAQALCDNSAVRSLQLAPDGVVTQIYPLEGNEQGFIDLFADPDRATEAAAARDTGRMTLSGPFELYQGGLGMIARRPVYLDGADKAGSFWGFTIIVLDLPDALYPAELDKFVKSGFEYKLYRYHPDTQLVQIIDESSKARLTEPEIVSFEVPNGQWYFSVMPKGGWLNRGEIILEALAALLIAGLFGVTAGFVLRQKRLKEEYYRLAVTDQLTGLDNYSSLMAHLAENYEKHTEMSVFYMDLNCFKGINDTYGHDAGNKVLVEAARRLAQCFGRDGQVFRNGGDEFCAIVTGKYEKDLSEKISERIAEEFSKPFDIGTGQVGCSISIGCAHYPAECSELEDLLRVADDRMYQMKEKCAARGGKGL